MRSKRAESDGLPVVWPLALVEKIALTRYYIEP